MACPWALVAVHWTDAFDSANGWIEVDEYKPKPLDAHVVSVGFLWPDCMPGFVTLTASYMPCDLPEVKTIGMVTHIPQGMVNRVVVLGEPNWDSLTP